LSGLSYGALLYCLSSGLVLIYSVIGIVNFAHGTIYMLGAYFSILIIKQLNIPGAFWISLIVTPALLGGLGWIVERLTLRPLYERDPNYQLLMTYTLTLILTDLVRLGWGTGYQHTDKPPLLASVVQIFGFGFPAYNFFVIIVGLILAIGTWYWINRTLFGKIIRASASDREMASAVGIRIPRIYSLTIVIGFSLCGLGGALAAPLRFVSPEIGIDVLLDAFIVVVLAGLGSIPGAFFSAIIIGQAFVFGTRLISQFQIAITFAIMAIVLLVRPQGLFGKEG
jgi:branched-chain amino acid transport system permease protein